MFKSVFKKGDTIIEVLLATAVFASVMIGVSAVMNSGIARGQSTLQLTMTRNAIDAQAEALRFVNNAYMANSTQSNVNGNITKVWADIVKTKSTRNTATAFSLNQCTATRHAQDFVVDPVSMTLKDNSTLRQARTYPRIARRDLTDSNLIDRIGHDYEASEGLWVEAIKPNASSNYVDFHIRACWTAPGNTVPTTLGTIVRLYNAL